VFGQVLVFRDFASTQNRDPYPDNDFVQNDKGGCDLEFLGGFSYKDKDYDAKARKLPIEHCTNWFALHAAELVL
jgi:hypothetical protein